MQDPDHYPPKSALGLFLKMGGWVVIIFGIVMTAVSLIGETSFNTAKRFEAEGLYTTALVTNKYTTESRDSDGNRTVTYWLDIEYVTEAGEEMRRSETAGSGFYRGVAVGEEIEIRYLRSAPHVTELEEGSYATGAAVARWIALGVGLSWLGMLWMVGRWTVEALRARRYGARETAEVTEVVRTAIRVNNRPRYRVHWRDAQGRSGKSLLRKAKDVDGWRKGDTIRIYRGLKRTWWAGDIGDPPGER